MMTLRELRTGRGVSVAHLARRAGVVPDTVRAIEEGRSVPRHRTVRRLCAALGVEPGDVAEFARAIGDGPAATAQDRLARGG